MVEVVCIGVIVLGGVVSAVLFIRYLRHLILQGLSPNELFREWANHHPAEAEELRREYQAGEFFVFHDEIHEFLSGKANDE